jgi:hypothetical protein
LFPKYVPKGASLLDPWNNRYGCQDIGREWPEGPKVWSNGFLGRESVISRSGTRKSSDANLLAVTQGFDFAQR